MHDRSAHSERREAAAPEQSARDPSRARAAPRNLKAIPRWAANNLPAGIQPEFYEDSAITRAEGAVAVTVGSRIFLSPDIPTGEDGRHLIAHELAHVVQQTAPQSVLSNGGPVSSSQAEAEAGAAANALLQGRPMPRLSRAVGPARQVRTPVAGPANRLTEYPSGVSRTLHRLGEAAGHRLLTAIEAMADGTIVFEWFDLEAGERRRGPVQMWEGLQQVAIFGGQQGDLASVQGMLTPTQWAAMPNDATAELLRLHEAQTITLPAAAVVAGYRGMVYQQAMRMLDENESAIDGTLRAGRVDHFQEYARGLKEASVIRDALVTRRDEIRHSLVQQHGFSFGIAGNIMNLDTAHRLELFRQLDPVERTLQLWLQQFPLLTRG